MKENWDGTNFIIISVYGILPAFIHKVSQLPTSGCGYSFGPAILIIDKSWNDKGLLIHELTHVKQWYRSFGRSSNKLSTDMNYRIKTEIEALSNQIKLNFIKKKNLTLMSST